MTEGPDKRSECSPREGFTADCYYQAGFHPGLHSEESATETGEMEQAGCLRRAAGLHPQLHREGFTAGAHHLPEHRGSAPGTHGLAQPPQEQGCLLREEARQAPARAGGGPPGLYGVWGHSPQHSG